MEITVLRGALLRQQRFVPEPAPTAGWAWGVPAGASASPRPEGWAARRERGQACGRGVRGVVNGVRAGCARDVRGMGTGLSSLPPPAPPRYLPSALHPRGSRRSIPAALGPARPRGVLQRLPGLPLAGAEQE